jgi:two-component sensor histidine kinase/CheY-like chemotaxis protein
VLTETQLRPSYTSALHDELDQRRLEELRERETWLSGQRQAFESALSDAPLAESLGILVDTAIAALGFGVRAAFYVANMDGTALHHVVGMSAEYAQAADGIVGPESLASGLAAGQAVLTADVRNDPRWEPWLWMAARFGYRGCWSFPIHTVGPRFAGTFVLYWSEPREPTASDTELAGMITQTAAIIISRHERAEQRRSAVRKLQETQSQLESELRDSELLRQISLELLDEDHEDALYDKLVEAAATIMHSEVSTVQIFHPERGPAGELRMLASRGLPPEGVRFFEWVRGDSGCTCGEALRTGKRAIAEDVATCAFMDGKPDRDVLLAAGIRAGQSTPLITRSGKLVGMISTHWAMPHRPSERDLRMFDILARPTADLIERKRSAETQRLLLNELNHRVKNTLAVVQAMAQRTLTRHRDPKEFAKIFGGRVQALARVHTLLSETSWQGAELGELIGDQVLLGRVDDMRLTADGPVVRLDSQLALHMALILHELGTNSTKYGALSVPTGRVLVRWVADDALRIHWTERGGPRVTPSPTQGFGTTLIAQSVKGQGGEAHMTSEPEGISWSIVLPFASGIVGDAQAAPMSPRVASTINKSDTPSLEGLRFLVVEDEPLIGLDIVGALEGVKADVEGPVTSVEKALELIEQSRFDAVLLDANLHGSPVDSIASALSQGDIPFAFVTGYNSNALPQAFRGIPVLNKPCSQEQVIETAVSLVARAAEKQAETIRQAHRQTQSSAGGNAVASSPDRA